MDNSELCSIEGCRKSVYKHGWCGVHYGRNYRHGDPLGGGTQKGAPEKFLKEVALLFKGDECLVWPYAKNKDGYGEIRHNGKSAKVNRVICEEINGFAPSRLHESAHSCGNGHTGCCNPNHLRWATKAENQLDRTIHGTANIGERNGLAKLKAGDICIIRSLADQITKREISKQFGISESNVRAILGGITWSHVV